MSEIEKFIREVIITPKDGLQFHLACVPDFHIRVDYLFWTLVAWFLKNPEEIYALVVFPSKSEAARVMRYLKDKSEAQGLTMVRPTDPDTFCFFLDGKLRGVHRAVPRDLTPRPLGLLLGDRVVPAQIVEAQARKVVLFQAGGEKLGELIGKMSE